MAEILANGSITSKILSGLSGSEVLSEQVLEEIVAKSNEMKKNISEVLITEGHISKETLSNFIEKYLELPRVDLTSYVPDPEALKLIPKSIVHRYLILPLFEIEGMLTVALSDPITTFYLDSISEEIGIELDPVLSTEDSLIDAVIIYYGISPDEVSFHGPQFGSNIEDKPLEVDENNLFFVDLDRLGILEGSAVADLLLEILLKAKKADASAVHIEPIDGDFRILFRLESFLRTIGTTARSLQKPLSEYIKSLSKFPRQIERPVEKILEIPRIGEMVVSIYPTIHGERIVLTFEKGVKKIDDIEQLGMEEKDLRELEKTLNKREGLIVIGAPVTSGKTTTLRTFLKYANKEGKSAFLLASEEVHPVEGVQFQKLRGEELLSAIEGIIHQDIDIVGIDEIDSDEAIRAAIRLSEKSLVIVTLESTSVVDSIDRMFKAGVETFSLSWALDAVISQRLLKKNCSQCIEEYKSPLSTHKIIKKLLGENASVYRSKGCKSCESKGSDGYLAVHEIAVLSEAIKRRIATNYSSPDFLSQIRGKGVKSILITAMEKVKEKSVTLEEVYRVTGFKE